MKGPSTEDSDDAIADINIIPLVDVVLVLLIIFMVTTVFTKDSAMPLDLPKGSSRDQVVEQPVQITVSVDKAGIITVNGQPTVLKELGGTLDAQMKKHAKTLLVVRGDSDTIYGKIIPVLDEVSRTGAQITLALQPRK
jgi:biopolymer transport protein ExbD